MITSNWLSYHFRMRIICNIKHDILTVFIIHLRIFSSSIAVSSINSGHIFELVLVCLSVSARVCMF